MAWFRHGWNRSFSSILIDTTDKKYLELLSVFMMVALALEQFLVSSSWQPSSIVLSLLAILAIFYLTVGIRHRLTEAL